MLHNLGKTGAALPPEKMIMIYKRELDVLHEWLQAQPNFNILSINHSQLVLGDKTELKKIAAFLKKDLNIDAMMKCIDLSLYRSKV
jgi:hypothetical protein